MVKDLKEFIFENYYKWLSFILKKITQKPKYKIKYSQSKASGCKQQLEPIRRHKNLLKDCSQSHEIIILNFKDYEYEEQLNLV